METCSQPPVDWQACLELCNDKTEFAKDMLQIFLKELPTMQQDINQAYDNKQFDAMQDIVHKLHGACCYCSVPSLKKIVTELESQLKSSQHELDELLVALNNEQQRIVEWINQYIIN